MDIVMRCTFNEREAVSLLCWLSRANSRLLGERPDLPSLYESGVVYEREEQETWCDVVQLYAQRWEDCDGLAAARAGELIARGVRAMRPDEPGYAAAREEGLGSIPAEVCLTTRVQPGEHGQYHCIVVYRIMGRTYWDDPSARLGMLDDRITAWEAHRRVLARVRLDGVNALGRPATLADRLKVEQRRDVTSGFRPPHRSSRLPRKARRAA